MDSSRCLLAPGRSESELLQQMLDRVIVYPDRIEIALYDGTEALLRLGEIEKTKKGTKAAKTPRAVLVEEKSQNENGPGEDLQARSLVGRRFVYRIEWLPNPVAGLTTTDPRLTACMPPEPEPPPKPTPGERARVWQRMLEKGVYRNRAALARGEGVSRAAVTQALRKR